MTDKHDSLASTLVTEIKIAANVTPTGCPWLVPIICLLRKCICMRDGLDVFLFELKTNPDLPDVIISYFFLFSDGICYIINCSL